MAAKKSLQERMDDLEERQQRYLEKAKQYGAQMKKLEQQKKQEERKIRTRLLIRMGGVAESVLQRPIEEDDIERFLYFLRQQEQRGGFFTKAMTKPETEISDASATTVVPETDGGEA